MNSLNAGDLARAIAEGKQAFAVNGNSKLNAAKIELHQQIMNAIKEGDKGIMFYPTGLHYGLCSDLKSWLISAGCTVKEESGDQRERDSGSFWRIGFWVCASKSRFIEVWPSGYKAFV